MENYMAEILVAVLVGAIIFVLMILRGIVREMTTTIQSQAGIIQEQALAALLTSCNEDTLGKLPIGAIDKIGKLRGIATPTERMMKPDKEQEKEKIAEVEKDLGEKDGIPKGGVKLHVSC